MYRQIAVAALFTQRFLVSFPIILPTENTQIPNKRLLSCVKELAQKVPVRSCEVNFHTKIKPLLYIWVIALSELDYRFQLQ